MEPRQAKVSVTQKRPNSSDPTSEVFKILREMQSSFQNLCRIAIRTQICGVRTVSAAAIVHVPRVGGHDETEQVLDGAEDRFCLTNELSDLTIRIHGDVAQEVVPSPHPERENESPINMPKFVGRVAEDVKNDCSVLHVR